MGPISRNQCMLFLITVLLSTLLQQCKAQSPNLSTTPSRQLDSLLQDYAYRAFVYPRTGKIYDSFVPANLTGIKISVLRLRSGSLRARGVKNYKEFQIPAGVVVLPHVKRLAFVYQNLGNWSSFYYPLPGFSFLTPVVGLLAYNAADINATQLNELDVVTSNQPFLIEFAYVKHVLGALVALQCVWFDLDGLPEFRDLASENVCSTHRQGHFAIVVNTTGLNLSPSPSPLPSNEKSHHKSRTWKTVASVVGGFVGLVLLALLVVWIRGYLEMEKVAKMERSAEAGETLQMAKIGTTQAPVASGTRTKPVLENEYVA